MPKKLTPQEKLQLILAHHLLTAPAPRFSSVRKLLKHHQTSAENLSQWRRRLDERIAEVFEDHRTRRRTKVVEKKYAQLLAECDDLRRRLKDFDDDDDLILEPTFFDDIEEEAAEKENEAPILREDEEVKWTPKVGQRGTVLINPKGTVQHVQETTPA